jgi:hypothetical protein
MKTEAPQTPIPMRELAALVGREEPLGTVHGAILRAVRTIRPVIESGAMLAACSDEFNGEIREAFDREVARALSAPGVPGKRRVFSVSNLGGRIEPGAIALANQHFTAQSQVQGSKLLLIEIASHVGRRETPQGTVWGELDRFGNPSPCCGALQLLLDGPPSASVVRFPWFDQLTAFFGEARLDALRQDTSPWRMVRTAIVHSVLQAETALVDLLREPPSTPTHVFLIPLLVVNRRGVDNAILLGQHHLLFEGTAQIVQGTSLRSTPSALAIDASRANLRVSSPFEEEEPQPAAHPMAPIHGAGHAPGHGHHAEHHELHPATKALHSLARSQEVRALVEENRAHLRGFADKPHGIRTYARPLLRSFVQGLSLIAPEVGLAAFVIGSGQAAIKTAHLKKLHERGPSTEEARTALKSVEPTLQQLSHREAREVLEYLLADHSPLFGKHA